MARESTEPSTATSGAAAEFRLDEGEEVRQNLSEADAKSDLTEGLIRSRSCTDSFCFGILAVSWLFFLMLAFRGSVSGDARRLYAPRDFQGAYCGLEASAQSSTVRGANLEDHGRLTYMMNVSGAVDETAKQLVCSTIAEASLRATLGEDELERYRCACCKSPCASCPSVLHYLSVPHTEILVDVVQRKLKDLTDPRRALDLFSTSGAFAGAFSNIFGDVDRYFVPACARRCDYAGSDLRGVRKYRYEPAPDSLWRPAWDTLAKHPQSDKALQKIINKSFVFDALPESECAYNARYCVPFPGIRFAEMAPGYCSFEVPSDVADAMGTSVGEIGSSDVRDQIRESFGTALGDVLAVWDVLAVVALIALVYGLLCMVLIRFFVKPAVLGTIVAVFIMLVAGGVISYLASGQCSEHTLMESGTLYAESLAEYARPANPESLSMEVMSGRGEDYRGMQTRTRSGRLCQRWDSQEPHEHNRTNTTVPRSDLRENFCRNPEGSGLSIWCYTTDPTLRWELCAPIGASAAVQGCMHGFQIRDPGARAAMEALSYGLFALSILWTLVICCIFHRIQIAIAVTEVAASFVFETPQILGVPVLQTLVGLAWTIFWTWCVAYMLTQVPDGHVAQGALTWAEASGAHGEAGRCDEHWPPGFSWRYLGDAEAENDPCSGRFGDVTGITPRCWKCASPRYVLDERFFYTLLVYLWNTELLLAVGVCTVAGACAIWFFRPAHRRGRASEGQGAVATALYNTFAYHVGSLAMGSFLIASVQFLRIALEHVQRQAAGQRNQVVRSILWALRCCMLCYERCLKYVHKNAYIHIALLGTSFCKSAKAAFALVERHLDRFAVLSAMGNTVRIMGVVAIVVATALTGHLALRAMDPQASRLLPMAVIVLLGYTVGQAFLNVFGLAADSMLQCLLVSEDMGLADENVPHQLKDLRHLEADNGEDFFVCCAFARAPTARNRAPQNKEDDSRSPGWDGKVEASRE